MKFNALVVAAMVITSVSAGGRKGLPGWLGGGRMTGSASSYDTFDNEPELEPPQDSSRHGPESRFLQAPPENEQKPDSSQDPPMSGPKPGSSQDILLIDLVSDYPQGPPENEQRLELSQTPSDDDSELEFSLDSSENRPDEPQDSVPIKKANPICSDINAELPPLWNKVYALNNKFQEQFPVLYGLMMMKKDAKGMHERGKRGKKDKKGHLKAKMIQAWLKSHPKDIPDLQNFKAEYISLEKDHGGILKRLDKNQCPNRYFDLVSLEEMAKRGHLPNWKDENGVDFLGKQ
ncbi:hypothetical protein BASA61_000798 [Batrachochytrium salamandrivorans]|nr:hypothetical protein BASA61_000798 [Batrachochytrium salamandrivorans]KAH9266992.1 hypothetical protein BASA83_010184 [Batrachochytrium salamandrivorans]